MNRPAIKEINGYRITKLPEGWNLSYAADNPKTGYGNKFYSLQAAIDWASARAC